MSTKPLSLSLVVLLAMLRLDVINGFQFQPRKVSRLPQVVSSGDDGRLPVWRAPGGHSKKSRPTVVASTSSSVEPSKDESSWKQRLLKFSNIASFLCVLDCTVLPAVTLLLPLLGFVTSPATSELFCTIGHAAALYFVLPVGFLATTTNYLYNHRKFWITSIGWLGMLLIFGANAPHGHHHHHHAAQGLIQTVLHGIQHGVAHRVTNLAGCALLILSNRISHRQQDCCGHDHGGHGRHHSH